MRLIPFEFNNQQTYILEFGNFYVRVRRHDNAIIDTLNNRSYIEVATPYTDSDIENIDFVQKGDVLFLVDGNHSPKQLERYSENNWQLNDYVFTNGPFKEQDNDVKGYFDYSNGEYLAKSLGYSFRQVDIGKNFNIETFFKAQTLFENNAGTGTKTSSVVISGDSWSFTTSGTWQGTIKIQISNDNSVWRDYKVVSSTINNGVGSYNASLTGDFDDIVFVRIVTDLTTNTSLQYSFQSLGFYENISFKVLSLNSSSIAKIQLEEFDNSVIAYANNYQTSANAEPLQPSAWEDGAYPKHITFYQDRLVFANTKNYPFTIWASETSDYYSFKIHSELLDSDSIQTNVVGDGLNEITALVSLMSLIAFTENGVFRTGIDSWNATSNFSLTKQSKGGACSVRPVTIDNSCIYVRPTKDNIRDFYYQYQIDSYAGEQLDILARDLFENKKIKQIAYQEQEKIIWVLFEDGSLVYCVYMKEQEILGWNEFETDGKVVSIATIMSNFNDTLFIAVERNEKVFIEKLDKRLNSKQVKDQIFLDSAIVYTKGGQYFNVITGLTALTGKTVTVLADGCVVKDKEVVNGEVLLNSYVKKAIVGLGYETIVETLDINFAGQGQDTKAQKRRIIGADIEFIDSCVVECGTSNGKIDEVIFREDEPVGQAVELKTECKSISFTSNSAKKTHIVIRQNKPLPFTVANISCRLAIGDK